MRIILSMALILVMACGRVMGATTAPATTPNQGMFTAVNGKVQVKAKKGKKTRSAKKDTTVIEGEQIKTDSNSSATLRLFEGSELQISPNTQFALSKLQQPTLQDKVIRFKLLVGKLFAKVKKLATSKSSFEIEAGGVVCGVRGTQYSYSYDPVTNQVTVHVDEGTVYLNSNGHTYIFTAGQTGTFDNGKPGKSNSGQSNGEDNGKKGDKGGKQTGISNLGDLNQQFVNGISINPKDQNNNPIVGNANSTLTDSGVEGSIKINVHAVVAPPETVP